LFGYLQAHEIRNKGLSRSVGLYGISAEEPCGPGLFVYSSVYDKDLSTKELRAFFKVQTHGRIVRVHTHVVKVVRIDPLHMVGTNRLRGRASRDYHLQSSAEPEEKMRLQCTQANDQIRLKQKPVQED
jgi:hypothetical protein